MSELRATPGPWTEGVDGNMRVYAPDGMGDQSGLIATVYKSRANTKLIAAAPELYEALKWAMCYVDQVRITDPLPEGSGEDAAYKYARAALAKARGDV